MPHNISTQQKLSGHVIVGLFNDLQSSPILGLCNFLRPLRASNIPKAELMPIVIVGDRSVIEKEWHLLQNFPEVYVKNVSIFLLDDAFKAGVTLRRK